MEEDTYREAMAEIMATPPSVAGIAFVALIMLVAILSSVGALLSFLFTMALFRIPEEHRKIPLGKVWLIMVPFYGVAWLLVTTRRLAASFRSYFDSVQETDEDGHPLVDINPPGGDYGLKVGFVLFITVIIAHLSALLVMTKQPMVILTGLGSTGAVAMLVAMIYFLQVFKARNTIPDPEAETLPESYI